MIGDKHESRDGIWFKTGLRKLEELKKGRETENEMAKWGLAENDGRERPLILLRFNGYIVASNSLYLPQRFTLLFLQHLYIEARERS